MVVDQFEELFTQTERVKQSRFIAALQALRTVQSCALLIAMRADFYPDLMNSDLWPLALAVAGGLALADLAWGVKGD